MNKRYMMNETINRTGVLAKKEDVRMQHKKRKMITIQMIVFELRNVIGNPYVHIFGVGMPIALAALITKVAVSELADQTMAGMITTSVYLGMGTLIPMATVLIGYAVSYAQELDKGIPQRMLLFGIKNSSVLCNRAISEVIFITAAFLIFFGVGCVVSDIEQPKISGLFSYILCIFVLSLILLVLAHGIACICRNFGRTYCVSMLIYFAFMMVSGMMGVQYENLPKWVQAAAKMLPVMYINRDFYQIWSGEKYNYMPMIQSYLFLGAVSGILLFFVWKRSPKDEISVS